MPLFEGSSKRRRADKELGSCGLHAESAAVAACSRCQQPMCTTCRTRWHEEIMCPACVERSRAADEPSPQEAQRQARQAWLSVGFALGGWGVLLLALAPLATFHEGPPGKHMVVLAALFFFCSFVPALLGLGQAASALRLRGRHLQVATYGLVLTGAQLGLMFGLFLLNLWQN
jgi:hypothetical protein